MSFIARRPTWILFSIVVFAVLLTAVFAASAAAGPKSATKGHATDRILVAFKPGTSEQSAAAAHASRGTKARANLKAINVQVVDVPDGSDVSALVESYLKNPNVVSAEPDYTARCLSTPNDTLYFRQWAPAYVNAPAAWDTTAGSPTVTIAIVDTGVQLSHPDLAGRVLCGYDFVNGDGDPSDDNGHGTGVAGIAAATGNNALGVAGMDWNARVLPVKVMDASGSGTWSIIAQGIIWAADQGADVINMSFGGPASTTIQSAIQYAYGKGCVLVAASGNEASGMAIYPAGYTEVIAVGSVYRDTISAFSNYGSHLDVAAPGETIDTIALGSTYGRITGTSAAAPFVSGLAALVRGVAPSLSPAQVMDAITSSARDLGASGWDAYYGWGHIDAQGALAAVGAVAPVPTVPEPTIPEPTVPDEPPADTTVPDEPPADTIAPVVSITSPAGGTSFGDKVKLVANATDDVGVLKVEFYANGKLIGTDKSAPYGLDFGGKKWPKGSYTLTAKAYDAAGNVGTSSAVVVTKTR